MFMRDEMRFVWARLTLVGNTAITTYIEKLIEATN